MEGFGGMKFTKKIMPSNGASRGRLHGRLLGLHPGAIVRVPDSVSYFVPTAVRLAACLVPPALEIVLDLGIPGPSAIRERRFVSVLICWLIILVGAIGLRVGSGAVVVPPIVILIIPIHY